MIAAPIPSHESSRLAALYRYQILDTSPEPVFDELARLAAYVCRTPIAVISLVDSSRQWFKSVIGLSCTESPRSLAFCAHTILGRDLFIVEEADADERFLDHPWVIAPPAVRFYAGVPLLTDDGHAIGSLAVMDVVPRTLTPEQRAAMQTLANQVMAQCELRGRRSVRSGDEPDFLPDARPAAPSADGGERKVEDDAYRWQQVFDQAEFGLAYGAISTNTFVTVNRTFARQCGYTVAELIGRPILSIYAPQEHAAMKERFSLIEREGHLTFESVHQRKDGTTFPVLVEVTVIKDAEGRPLSRVAYVKDISERKQAEEALQLAKFTVDHAAEAIYWVGANAELLDVNESACAMLGYSKDEFLRMTVHDINPDFQADSWPAYWEETRLRGAAFFESRHRAKDGRLIPIEVSVNVLRREGRECHCAFVRDITGRKQVEQARAQALHDLRTILETVPDVIYALDCQGRLSRWNEQLAKVTGYAPEELHLKSALEMVPVEEGQRTAEAIQLAFDTGYAELEGQLLTKDGRTIPYHWTGAPFTDLNGQVIGITGAGRDITVRKHFEEALRQSEERYRRYFELGLIGMAVTSLEKGWVQVNDRLCEIFGYTQDELKAKTWIEITHPDDVVPDVAQFNRVLAGAIDGYAMDKRFLHKDGRIIYASISARAVRRADGSIDHFVALVQDITVRKKTEQLLSGEKRILELIGSDAPLPVVLNELCRMIEGLSDGALCSVLLLDDDGVHLRHGAAPSLPEAYVRAIDGVLIGPGAGSCGTAAFTGTQVFVGNIATDPLWADFRDAALPHGLRACWSTPILSAAGTVLGTFTIYYRTVQDASGELSIVDRASHLACLAIERKGAEAALRMTRFSIERVSDSIFWIDSAARIVDVNEAACRRLQYSRQELLSMHLFDIDPHVTADNWSGLWQKKLEGRSLTFESSHIRKDGTVFSVELTCNHLQFGGQEFCCAIQRDISERKHAEALLRLSEERFRLVAEATNDILWDWDLVTQDHWWSPNAREKFGYDPNAERSVAAWTGRLHPDDRDRVMALVEHALASDARTAAAEYRFRLADGSYGHFYDRGQIIRDSTGRAVRMVGAMIDVTFTKRAYATLEEAYQRLQGMSRELQAVETNERRRLSRELHDEVGQLLTALKFDLEASRQALSGGTEAQAGRAFERTVRALETTDELFVRLRRVVRALRPSVLDELGLKDALEAMVSDIQSRSDLVCSVSVGGAAVEDPATPAIEAALYRMAQELVTNVVRHAQAMTLSVALETDANRWTLTVQDDGVGFNPMAESISGMGIRGVRERAEILGGQVEVSSLPGAGTTITVRIPVRARTLSGDGGNGR